MTDHPLGKPPIDAMELAPRRVRAARRLLDRPVTPFSI
jgi:hypothetical protein